MPKKVTRKAAGKATKKTAKKKANGKGESKAASTSTSSEKTPPKGSTLDAWAHRMKTERKWKGKIQIRRANEVTSPYIYRRPTGLLSLDLALGGGVHAGGVCEICGEESAGKTYLTYMVAGQVQRNYGEAANILIACTEILPDVGFARQAGFCIGYDAERIEYYNNKRIEVGLEPLTKEEREDLARDIGRVEVMIADTGESLLQGIIEALDASRDDPRGGFQLIIIESLGALLPASTEEKDVGEVTFGGSAPMITRFQNKVYPRLIFDRPDGTKQLTSLVGISQIRANTNAVTKYDPKTKSSTGAHAWKHAQLACIELSRGKNERVEKEVIGKHVYWKLAKGKAGTRDGKRGECVFYHLDRNDPIFWKDVLEAEEILGFDTITDAVGVAKKMGIIEGTNWLTWTDGSNTILKAHGIDKFATELMDNPDLLVQLRLQCLKQSGIKVRY